MAQLADQGHSASASQQEMEDTIRQLKESEASLSARVAQQQEVKGELEREAAEAASVHSEQIASMKAGILELKAAMQAERIRVRCSVGQQADASSSVSSSCEQLDRVA
jgi:uncharacterized protein YdcH (DUF465 family)